MEIKKPIIYYLDIEATDLSADMGFMLCASVLKEGEKKIKTFRIDKTKAYKKDVTDDSDLVAKTAEYISDADFLVFHYGSRYDFPFIQTRLLYHKLPVLPPIEYSDTWAISRGRLRLRSNRLAALTELFGVRSKTHLDKKHWRRAGAGYSDSIDYVVKHCEVDVKALQGVYKRIRALAPHSHPNYNIFAGTADRCRICGTASLAPRGYWRGYRRYKCKIATCGAWSRSRTRVEKLNHNIV